MTSRRQFLQIGMVASAATLVEQTAIASADPGGSVLPIYAAVYDARFAEGIEFGRCSESLGLSTRRIEGDMTAVWYGDFHPLWTRRPIAIAGLTGHGALFRATHSRRCRDSASCFSSFALSVR